jgi:hypothetical protein
MRTSFGRVAERLVVLLVAVAGVGSAGAATIVGQNGVTVSLYDNPFAGSTNTHGAIGGGTVNLQGGYPESFVVNRVGDGRASTGMGALESTTAAQGYMQLDAVSAFMAGTVIGDQWLSSYYGASPSIYSNMAYALKLDGTTAQTGPGIPGSHAMQVTTLAKTISVRQLRLEMNLAEYNNGGSRYGNFKEVVLLPERMQRVALAGITQPTGTTAGYPSLASLCDLSGAGTGAGSDPNGGWVGSAGSVVTFDFGGAHTVRALLCAAWEDAGLATKFNVKNDAGTIVANVDLAAGDYLVMRFDTPVTTSKLTLSFFAPDDTTPATAAMREIMILEDVPPAGTVVSIH